jgi:hypothetical protein
MRGPWSALPLALAGIALFTLFADGSGMRALPAEPTSLER